MSSDAISAADLLLRGGALFLLVLLALLLLRDHPRSAAARLGAGFAIGAAAHAFSVAGGFHVNLGWLTALILAIATANNLVFWLFARALFDDGFRPRPWHAVLWLLILAASLMCGLFQGAVPAPQIGIAGHLLAAQAVLFAVLGGLQAAVTWRADLIERRRRLRLFIVVAAAGYTVVSVLAGVLDSPSTAAGGDLWRILPMLAIAFIVACALLRISDDGGLFPVATAPVADTADAEPLVASPADAADGRMISALERMMTVDRAYRQEGLTIGGLATMLAVPEYKLRRLINTHLGHRNFASFLNRYRLEDARTALADPSQAAVPILTIALDAGFSSLGPFNRSFKAETGMTPSEFRRLALEKTADSGIGDRISETASRISKPA